MIATIRTRPLDDEVARYIVENYANLLTPIERSALRAARAEARSLLAGSPADRILELWVDAAPPEAKQLTAGGELACIHRLANRLWTESARDIVLNTCPQCGGLAKTPTTKLCHHCWHDWH